jgi:hypothetical protein
MVWVKTWSKEEIEKAAKLVASGMTASEVGKQIGRSRNSVIGAMHRNGVAFNSHVTKDRAVKRAARPSKPKAAPQPKASKPLPVQVGMVIKKDSKPVPLMDARYFECRYIVHSNHDEPFKTLCCGNQTHRGSSWCKTHYNIVFMPRPPKQERK